MPFINTAGLTIFGDGSQWFWSMAGFFAIPITGYAIYSQLRAQRSANRVSAFFALRDEWRADHLRRSYLEVLIHHAAGKPGWPPTLAPVGAFFERLALLVKRRDVNAEDAWAEWGVLAQALWLLNAAMVAGERKNDPRLWEHLWQHWEAMVQAMAEISRRRGIPPLDLEMVRAALPVSISDLIEAFRIEQEAKAGVVPSWSPPQVAED
ncbi:MAG TPA: hypothetical protein VJ506_02330 [Candidatus Limnocylindrales bacterium]|nr:hypothetical protein [Candidatus Limnocylindrales bacterium]